MVRLKHRWTTIRLSAGPHDSVRGLTPADISRAIELSVLTLFGDVGLGQLTALAVVVYWYPANGVFVYKTTMEGYRVLRPSVALVNEIALVSVQPQIINTSATLVQTRRFLIDYFHAYLRDEYNRQRSAAQRERLRQSVSAHDNLVLALT